MSDEFQLRKDIDRFKHFLDELDRLYNENGVTSSSLSDLLSRYYDKSEVDVVTSKLYDDITSLDTNLDTLKANLVSFNQKLITFNGDTETLATDLSTLGNNLNSVLGDISTITADLSTLSDNFDKISDLTSLSKTAFPFTSNATDYDSDAPVKITKWGRVITVSGRGKLTRSVSLNSNVRIGTMPPSYLPSYNIYTPWTGENTQGFIEIKASGSISLHNNIGGSTSLSSGDYFVFNCSYMI